VGYLRRVAAGFPVVCVGRWCAQRGAAAAARGDAAGVRSRDRHTAHGVECCRREGTTANAHMAPYRFSCDGASAPRHTLHDLAFLLSWCSVWE
jgi:hypothetical protein